ncbi:MAG: type I DNA topoisomerase [Spirochaetes bacterium]|nr:type I DNA topoisomerase [Spirochaetota bacterium]
MAKTTKTAGKTAIAKGTPAAVMSEAGKSPAVAGKNAAGKKRVPASGKIATLRPGEPGGAGTPKAGAGKTVKAKSSRAKGPKPKTLVIVESPAKAKTIEKYLGDKYVVLASMGHLIDLPKSRIGVDVDHGFEPEYLTIRGKATLLKELRKAARKSSGVLLASDNDREGEAISFNIRKALLDKIEGLPIKRIVFNEITPQAIREAVSQPRDIDVALVNAQKARRVLDRIVGYYLSPLLWKKVKNGLSAGRVQSAALRIICEREVEVESFIPEEYWTLDADFRKGRAAFSGELFSWRGQKPVLSGETAVREIIDAIDASKCVVSDIRETEKSLRPKPPFTTSQLQQTAANKLGFTSKKTMQIAQQLYEGVNIGSTRIGLITYMRTDSFRVSKVAIGEVREFIGKYYPAELPGAAIEYTTDRKAQDAHEAVRPTSVGYNPADLKNDLTKDQLRLYTLIWERFVASQMTNAKMRSTALDLAAGDAIFRVNASKIVEKGFYKVIKLLSSKEEKETILPEMKSGDPVKLERMSPEQHFTQGSARFTDASIIRALEEQGIGRPSTYAPIISVLLDRYYVTRENRQLKPTTLGRMINDILVESFPDVINVGFTAGMEEKLDEVEESRADWVSLLSVFYAPFKLRIDEIMESLQSYRGRLDEATDIVCEKCGKPMVKKLGRFGFFLACTGFPDCKNTRSIPLAVCPRCGGDIVSRRKSKGRGREFYGCTRYPECDFISYHKPTNSSCPKCGWFLVEKFDKRRGPYKACINPQCDYLHTPEEEEHVDAD